MYLVFIVELANVYVFFCRSVQKQSLRNNFNCSLFTFNFTLLLCLTVHLDFILKLITRFSLLLSVIKPELNNRMRTKALIYNNKCSRYFWTTQVSKQYTKAWKLFLLNILLRPTKGNRKVNRRRKWFRIFYSLH